MNRFSSFAAVMLLLRLAGSFNGNSSKY